jgi:microcystin degradation protein MlrC
LLRFLFRGCKPSIEEPPSISPFRYRPFEIAARLRFNPENRGNNIMRLFTAALATETNTFSPIPTGRQSFTHRSFGPGQAPAEPTHYTAPVWVGRRRAKQEGFTLVEGSTFATEPSGTCAKSAYEEMRDTIMAELKAAMPVDGIMFGLHGAFVAEGYDDVEGDILEKARAIVGPGCVIGVELDPHCHLTEKRVRLADIIILYKEYPHTDFVPRAEELLTIVLKTIRGEIRPVASLYDCRMIAFFPTTMEPTRSFVDRMSALEGKDGVLSVSLGHGFPHADVPEMGTRVLVYTDNAKKTGDALATRLGREIEGLRGKTSPKMLSIRQALSRFARADTATGPVVIAEPADNAGGGSASDNTLWLQALLKAGIGNSAVAPVWDPQAVRFAQIMGVGATFSLRLGGKTSALSHKPVDCEVEVLGLAKNAMQSFGDAMTPLGDMAALRVNGLVDVVVNTNRTQALGRELFTLVGIDPAKKALIVLKSAQHFHAAFGPIASQVLYSETMGPSTQRYETHPYTRVKRPMYPLDKGAGGGMMLT